MILRYKQRGRYEETGRGLHRKARQVWEALVAFHEEEHRREQQARAAAEANKRKRKPRTKRAA
ncbi:hypothetical protein [Nonomuraea angiospora]